MTSQSYSSMLMLNEAPGARFKGNAVEVINVALLNTWDLPLLLRFSFFSRLNYKKKNEQIDGLEVANGE